MITLSYISNELFPLRHESTDFGEKGDYYQALNLWKSEARNGFGERRDIAADIIKNCIETGSVKLNLSGLNLTSLPVLPPHIEELNVGNNVLKTLPSFPDTLKILKASHNRLMTFPAIASGSSLEELYLADNFIKIKPQSAGSLQHLDLSNNPLCFVIPKIIHHIWLGDAPFPYEAMINLVRNVDLNPDYVIKLWVDNPKRTHSELMTVGLTSAIFARVEILRYSAPYELEAIILRECADTPYKNYAAASDVLRLSVLRDFGGIYMDVDIALSESLGDILIDNQFGQPAVDSLFKYDSVTTSDDDFEVGVINGVIAALKDAKDIDFLLEAIKAVYTGKEFTLGPNKTKFMDFFKHFWSGYSGDNSLTAQIKVREVLRTQEKLNGSAKLEALNLLDETEKNKRLEALSNYNRNLFSDDADFANITWGLKRERALVRYTGTLSFTGPLLLFLYLNNEKPGDLIPANLQQDPKNGFHSVRKFIKTDIFGKIEDPFGKWIADENGKGGRVEHPMGRWTQKNNDTGDWIAPAMHGWITDI
ncbi:TcdA/TcdB catalytic glycosyltransferase domain-containing protein [Sodalis sp. RH20]|uniref:TcdA/TcdB catalytic glycosyltransferase domain-containing protein n=1 Tax=unclassified Sodalis (in: enterobacteria) TaxID=2636512 RepID=UPI0039B5EEA2